MNITVIHTLAPEIIALLQGFTNNQNGGSAFRAAETTKVKNLSPVKEDVKEENHVNAASDTGEVTIEHVRAATQAKAKGGKREEAKALLEKYGVAKVTELDKSKYAEFLNEVNAL